MNLLTVAGINKTEHNQTVVKDISFSIKPFQKIAIAGETGSGKSTLLKIIAGLIQPDRGEVLFEGQRVLGPEEKLLPGHPSIAYLSQHFELRNNYKVQEILEMANKMPEENAQLIYEVCRIDKLLGRKTDQLSGGEKQRIAIARLLVNLPKLLLLDEPYSNLDMIHKAILKDVIRDISERLRITSVLISHDPADTLSWADEVIVMKSGKIVQQGHPADIYYNPVNDYTAALFGKYKELTPTLSKALGIAVNKQEKQFIRPNELLLEPSIEKANATIKKVTFYGSYYEIEVLLEEETIYVRSSQCPFSKGEAVRITLDERG